MREETSTEKTLAQALQEQTREGALYEKLEGEAVRCVACGHRCFIKEGRAGICKVRFNDQGILKVPYGYASGIMLDPIEKKPFFHAYPGSTALSFGMLGCDFHCGYCQNWVTSQTLRDPASGNFPEMVTPEAFVSLALAQRARVVTSTYNEPLITSEWAVEIFQLAKAAGLVTSYVSNGNATPEVLSYLRPWVDLYKVDLKSFNEKHYRELGGVLQNILDTIPRLVTMGFWVEIVTLLVPGFNNDDAEIRNMARFLRSVSPDIPWHLTAFHKDYKMQDPEDTRPEHLIRAGEIGKAEGLHFVYLGNMPGQVGDWEHTYCPGCKTLLIERWGHRVMQNCLQPGGHCPTCQRVIPGRWA